MVRRTRPQMCTCTSGNLEIIGARFRVRASARPGMTADVEARAPERRGIGRGGLQPPSNSRKFHAFAITGPWPYTLRIAKAGIHASPSHRRWQQAQRHYSDLARGESRAPAEDRGT